MKKLMIAACAVALAAAAQAATVDWQYSITSGAAKNIYDSGYTVYLVDAAKWAALTAVTADTFADSSIVYGSTTFAEGSGKTGAVSYYTKNAIGTKGSYATDLSDSIVAEGGSLAVKYIVVNNNENPIEYSVGADATLTGRASTGETIESGFGTQTAGSLSFTPVSGAAIPEPTSAMLLLLGVAGLALRRKQA